MNDECLLALYDYLIPDAKAVLKVLTTIEATTMENLKLHGHLRTQQVRKGVWGLMSGGLITYELGQPVSLSENGRRLITLLKSKE